MRKPLLALASVFLFSVFPNARANAEVAPVSDGLTFGIANGTYASDGTLTSKSDLIPDLSFHSVRTLENGVIEATTHATLFGIPVATASAHLKIAPTSAQAFDVLDVDGDLAKAGSGTCDSAGCTFTATVMQGSLTLTETWIASESGFSIQNCSQTFKGQDATYSGEFKKN